MDRPVKILLAKVGLDGHDRGLRVIAGACRDAGFEVIYAGLRQTPQSVVEAAVQEDVDAIGVSILSAAHMTVFPAIIELLRQEGLHERVLLTGGGIIPDRDAAELQAMGVGRLFTPGAPLETIIGYIRDEVQRRRELKGSGLPQQAGMV